jgi:hypothetical protein
VRGIFNSRHKAKGTRCGLRIWMFKNGLHAFVLRFIKNLLVARILVLKIKLLVVACLYLVILLKVLNEIPIKMAINFFIMQKVLMENYQPKFI